MKENHRTFLLALVVLSTVAGTALAASNGSISASPAEPSVTSTHTVTATVGTSATGSWNGFSVNYQNASANVSDVGQGDVVKIGIDRGDDASGTTIDVDVSDDLGDVQITNNGETLTVKLGGSYSLNESDEVVVVYEDAQNPEAGTYDIGLDVNPQSSGGQTVATLEIGSDGSDSSTTTDETTTEDQMTTTDETTEEETTDDGTTTDDESGDSMTSTTDSGGSGDDTTDDSGGGVPGFGVGTAIAALLGAALLAHRRRA
jgi:PGF-CTERM protein